MVGWSVGDTIECTRATNSAGAFSVPLEVGWRGKVQNLTDFDAFIEFQNPSHQRTIALWVRESEFSKFVMQNSSKDEDEEGESELGEPPFHKRQCTADELNLKLEAVGGF